MHITTTSLSEFFEILDSETKIFQSTIHVDVSKTPLDGDRFSAVRFSVVLRASVVVEVSNESQYILVFGYDCGKDYRDSNSEENGTKVANEMKAQIREYASSRNWKILPGVIGF